MAGPYFGRWGANDVLELVLGTNWVVPSTPTPYATNLIKPTSIASTGTGNSSSIGSNGSVTFSSCATLSLNGVFSASFDNYMIIYSAVGGQVANNTIALRLRASGSDASGSNYTDQYVFASATSVQADRRSSQTSVVLMVTDSTTRHGFVGYFYGPYLAQPTAARTVAVDPRSSASLVDDASTHGLSSSYDGFTLITSASNITGLVSVYGLGQ